MLHLCVALRAPALGDAWPNKASVPFNQFPFLMTHDSATGYLGGGAVNWWAKTQTVGFGGQAECGARAFDVRPKVGNNGSLIMHHADITVDKELVFAVSELVGFANANPGELIIIYVSHCDGEGCMGKSQTAISGEGIPICTDGNKLKGATYGSVLEMGKLKGGGSVLAIFGFVNENYNAGIQCYGSSVNANQTNAVQLGPDGLFYCYSSDKGEQDAAFNPFWGYLRTLSARAPAASGELSMLQVLHRPMECPLAV
jgi:hypothetical protein